MHYCNAMARIPLGPIGSFILPYSGLGNEPDNSNVFAMQNTGAERAKSKSQSAMRPCGAKHLVMEGYRAKV